VIFTVLCLYLPETLPQDKRKHITHTHTHTHTHTPLQLISNDNIELTDDRETLTER
jgi:hypothetical protein